MLASWPSRAVNIAQSAQLSNAKRVAGLYSRIILPQLFHWNRTDISVEIQSRYQLRVKLYSVVYLNNETVAVNGRDNYFQVCISRCKWSIIGADAAGTASNLYDFLVASQTSVYFYWTTRSTPHDHD